MQNNSRLLLSILPGFAPILIYIAVEAVFGEKAGLAAGMALGIIEFLVILVRDKRVDAFTLVDTALLAVMGGLSWALSDPIFFRLKPAISGAVLALMMLAGSLGPHRFFLPYMEKHLGMGELPRAAARRMLAMIAGFGLLTLAHSALTAVAALFWSKASWNFVAGALFWILAFIYIAAWTVPPFLAIFRTNRPSKRPGEMLPVVDETGRVTGRAPRVLCHSGGGGEKPLHPVVRLWLTDGEGGLWMQKRSRKKLVQPGKWDCAVGGHVSFGENAETTLRREAAEEISLADFSSISEPEPLCRFLHETKIERELVLVYAARLKAPDAVRADMNEVDEIRLWTSAEIRAELEKSPDSGEFAELARIELLNPAIRERLS